MTGERSHTTKIWRSILPKISVDVHCGLTTVTDGGSFNKDMICLHRRLTTLNCYSIVANKELFWIFVNGFPNNVTDFFASLFHIEVAPHIRIKKSPQLLLSFMTLHNLMFILKPD